MALRDSQPRTIYLKDYRAPDFLIDKTELTIELGESGTKVASRLVMRRNPGSPDPKAPLVLHGRDLEVLSLHIDDRPLNEGDYRYAGGELDAGAVPDRFEFRAEVMIHPETNTSLEGLYKSRTMFCTQCEAEGFRKITFYLDRPDVLSEFTTTIIAEKAKYPVLLANGNPVDEGADNDGRHWLTWHDPFPKPAYLFATVAGDLAHIEDRYTTGSGRVVTLRLFVEDKDLDKCDFAMGALKRAMAWDEDKYGREYDLDIYMIVAVDDFNMGAMENKGLNLFNTAAVLAKPEITTDRAFQTIESIVAHEYFHNWSGNRVTCRDWFQLSLKEGFTVFRDSQFSEDMASPVVKRVEDVNMLRTLQFAEDDGPMAHPVQPDSYMEISNFYTLTIYEKGCEVVRMIHTLLGPEQFRRGADLYFERHDGQAVTIEDFVAAMAEVSGRDFSQFMNWYRQAGTPRLDIDGDYDAEAQTFTLRFRQSCPPTPECRDKKPYLIPVAMGLVGRNGDLPLTVDGTNGATHKVVEITEPEQTLVFENVPEPPVPSLLRHFSAPVKWHYPYSRDELLFLMARDSDDFNRWDAANQLAVAMLEDMIETELAGGESTLDERLVQAYRELLAAPGLDPAMVSLMLTLPTEAYLGEQRELIEVQAIHDARRRARAQIARDLAEDLRRVYGENRSVEPYAPEPTQVARRSLKNAALAYLSLTGDGQDLHRLYEQATAGDNMTDVHAALTALVNAPGEAAADMAKQGLDHFYRQWRDEPLAVNQWLQIQAGNQLPGGLERVQALMDHEAFDIRNPNKVRSLIGAFCNLNPVNFHRPDGAGHRFLADRILELNTINPQIAARALNPLTRWRRYPAALADSMKAQLERIRSEPALSPDVYEVVSKSLKDD